MPRRVKVCLGDVPAGMPNPPPTHPTPHHSRSSSRSLPFLRFLSTNIRKSSKDKMHSMPSSGSDQLLEKIQNVSSKLQVHNGVADRLVHEMQELKIEVEVMNDYQKAINELNDLASNSSQTRKKFVEETKESEAEMLQLRNENRELRLFVYQQREGVDRIMAAYRKHVDKLKSCQDMESQAVLIMEHQIRAVVDEKKERQDKMKDVMYKAVKLDEEFMQRQEDIVVRLYDENRALRAVLGQVPFPEENDQDPVLIPDPVLAEPV